MKQYVSQAETDNLAIAQEILTSCKDARIFAFYGELGAGKTTLIKRFCEVLGVTDSVTSPTFGLIHEYQGDQHAIFHFDMYRISSEMEAIDLGIEDYLTGVGYAFIEWPERILDLLPPNTVRIELSLLENHHRRINCYC